MLKLRDSTSNVGKITIFDENAIISFSDGKDQYTLSLPNTYITCIGNQSQTVIPNEEMDYDITSISNESTVITVEFNRVFKVNDTIWNEPWFRLWKEHYFLEIPGYMLKREIGYKEIPAPVPLHGIFTFDLRPYLPPGQSSTNYIFYVAGTDDYIDDEESDDNHFENDYKIHILLK